MKIQKCSINVNSTGSDKPQYNNSDLAFKGGSPLILAGNLMQFIEDKGFLASFLIQDTLGMTVPRAYTGYKRDMEVTGHPNFQEGTEVLLRESLTGPIMMAVAPLAFLVAAKFGKTNTVNSQLIKRFGENLKEMLGGFKEGEAKTVENYKEKFLKSNIKKILEDTLTNKQATEENINKIYEYLNKIENPPKNLSHKKVKQFKKEQMDAISDFINKLRYENSSELNKLNYVNVSGSNGLKSKSFETNKAFDALLKYSEDAISSNKDIANLDVEMAENLKNKFIAKRVITTLITAASTVGILSLIPKIYAKSDVSPGAKTAMIMKQKEENESSNNEQVSFKGGKKGSGILSKLGSYFSKMFGDTINSEFEYNGHNFTSTLMAILSVFGLLFPRGLRAYKRAQVDENGKRDHSEIHEILIRDLSSSLSVIFAVPLLTKLCISTYENKSGFVLLDKDRKQSSGKAFLDLINPYGKTQVLSLAQISSIYGNVDSPEKLLNFCKYISKNEGDLQKIFSKSPEMKDIFNDKFIEELNKLSKEQKNAKIIEFIKEQTKDKKLTSEQIKKLMCCTEKNLKNNKILSYARGLNSVPAVVATAILSPLLLGIIIPKITYWHSRNYHAKREEERKKADVTN